MACVYETRASIFYVLFLFFVVLLFWAGPHGERVDRFAPITYIDSSIRTSAHTC